MTAQIHWQAHSLPVYKDCKQIQISKSQKLFVNAGDLMVYNDSVWQLFTPQPPCDISLMSIIDTNKIYVADKTKYQNSNLYYWNGKIWSKIKYPMVNTIGHMSFSDDKNGILTGYGEILLLKNGNWQHLHPPSNRFISQAFIINENLYALVPGKGIYLSNKADKWRLLAHSKTAKRLYKINNKIYATGKKGLLQVIDNHVIVLSENQLWKNIKSLLVQPDKITGVGNSGLIVELKNNLIHKYYLPERVDLKQIIFYKDQYWIVGSEGSVYKSGGENMPETIFWKGFKQITFNQNAKIIDDEYGVVVADFNNDGLTDIFTCGLFEEDHLYINQGNKSFIDQAIAFGIRKENSNNILNLGACAGDIDNDGDMDLYVSILNGKNILYKNIEGKYFIDYSQIAHVSGKITDRTNACIMGDVDNDGDLDIFITNEYSSNRLYLNNGAGIFTEATSKCGLTTIEGGNSASFADIDKDGDIDLYVTNWSSKNILYQNMLHETGKLSFKDITASSQTGGKDFEKSNAVVFSDINNDMFPDLFVANRKTSNKLYINNKDNTFAEANNMYLEKDEDESYGAVITDFDGDTYKDLYVSNVGENRFYKNNRKQLVDATSRYGASIEGYSTGSAIADFDNDGDPDIYIANYIGTGSTLLLNNTPSNTFVKLKFDLYKNNTKGVGSKIYLFDKKTDSLLYATEITSGSGYVSMNDLTQSIPAYPHTYLKLIFPDGQQQIIDSLNGQSTILISDVKGAEKYSRIFKRFLTRQFFDSHRLFELIKWVFVLLFLFISINFYQKKYHWKKQVSVGMFITLLLLYYIQYRYFEYMPFLMSTLLPLTSIVLINLLVYYYFEQKHIKNEALAKQKEIKHELSRNLHDDLAATISSTGFYLAMMKYQLKEGNSKLSGLISKSQDLLQTATNTITDLIWSINPKPESLESILLRLQNNFKALFDENHTDFNIIWNNKEVKNLKVDESIKQNTYLILKEALNNILKYAKASNVSIEIAKKNNKRIEIKIVDNGTGFDIERANIKGYGLKNMKTRAEEMPGGNFTIISNNKGTIIIFSYLIP